MLHYRLARTTETNQKPVLDVADEENEFRVHVIRESFIESWQGYMKHAFPHDILLPLSDEYEDDRNGWGCTMVDVLPSAILFEQLDIIVASLKHIEQIDWDKVSSPTVSVFGTTIRYLGAMLSGFDLLTNTHIHLTTNIPDHLVQSLLHQSQNLADRLSHSFVAPTGIHNNHLRFPEYHIVPESITDVTVTSGLVLEWTRLSDLTGNTTYARLAASALDRILEVADEAYQFPGLLPKHVNINTASFNTSNEGGWSHAGGGFYEMLLKLSVYSPRFSKYLPNWRLAADSTMQFLASHPLKRPDLTFLADFKGSELVYNTDSSAAFAPASFLLGGVVSRQQKYIDFGLEILRTLYKVYRFTSTGLGPDNWGWIPDWCSERMGAECDMPEEYRTANSPEFTNRAGYFVKDPSYQLRPELFESLYYAYQITKEQKYRDWSWEIFQSVIRHCKAGSGFAVVTDVNHIPGTSKWDGRTNIMHSFLLSEVFMYAYIIHLDDHPWDVRTTNNEWVFSTQGHPMKVT